MMNWLPRDTCSSMMVSIGMTAVPAGGLVSMHLSGGRDLSTGIWVNFGKP